MFTIGQQFVGDPIKPEGCNYFVLPYKDGNTVLLQNQIQTFDPDLLIIQDDIFPLIYKDNLHQQDLGRCKLLLYAAIDGEPVAWNANVLLDKCDKLIGMTDYGKRVMTDAGYEDIDVIYHGVDTEMFKPLDDKNEVKEKISKWMSGVWKKDINLQDKCVFYACGRNTNRKDFPSLIRAFGKFAKGKDDVALVINSINYGQQDMNHIDWVNETCPRVDGSEEDMMWNKVFLFPAQSYMRGVPEEQIAQLTGMADAHVTTALGEGFGMVMLESMACGVPVISNEYSTPEELVGKERGLLAKSNDLMFLSWGIGHRPVNVDSFAEQLETFYGMWQDGKVEQTFKQNCLDFANNYTWDKVGAEWVKMVEKVLKQ